jgi:hypothetical protein
MQNNIWRARGSANHHFRNPDKSFGIEKIRLLYGSRGYGVHSLNICLLLTERPFVFNSSISKPNFLYIRAMYVQYMFLYIKHRLRYTNWQQTLASYMGKCSKILRSIYIYMF